MTSFDYQPRTRIVFGPGRIETLGELASELGARRALVVSDPGVIAAGHTAKGMAALERAGIETHLFEGVHENPTTDDVAAGVKLARRYDPEVLIGLGGGSSMDCCKGINFVFTNGGEVKDYWGVGKALQADAADDRRADDGGHGQRDAVVRPDQRRQDAREDGLRRQEGVVPDRGARSGADGDAAAARDGADGHRRAVARAGNVCHVAAQSGVAGVQPRGVAAVGRELCPRAGKSADDLAARGSMLLGASFAGLAIENSMLGAAHALANPLTTAFDVPHGQAVGVMLPHVIRFNAAAVEEQYHDLLHESQNGSPLPKLEGGVTGWRILSAQLLTKAGLATTLRPLGVDPLKLPHLAAQAAKQWTASFNPRPVGEEELLGLYQQAY